MQRLLVAGDNDDANRIHDCLREYYTRRGCSVLFCPAPGELMRNLRKSPPDVIFMHFQFAELTVYEIYQQIRALPEGRTLPIMVLETEMLGGTTSAVETLVLLKMPLTVSYLIRRCSAVLHQDVATRDATVLCEPTFMALDEDEQDAAEQATEERRRQLLREHSIRLREDEEGREHFHLISEQVRRRWFYHSDFVQGLFDRIEDSAWYQRHCNRKYGYITSPTPAEESDVVEESESTEGPQSWEPAPRRVVSAEERQRRKVRSGRLALAFLLAILVLCGAIMFGRAVLRSDTFCTQCAHHAEQVVYDIHRAECEECGGQVGFSCECQECDYEFGFVPGLDVKTRFGASSAPPCPECGSGKTVRQGR
ncbi:MAG: hypothetical protein HN904_18675 [Victivallales bacterium]|nr:hypothetical protein [Victivallales bacterium]MBT7164811.1 hypothetical protein [Victivallales bacterium]